MYKNTISIRPIIAAIRKHMLITLKSLHHKYSHQYAIIFVAIISTHKNHNL